MPFTSDEIINAGKAGLDFYLANKPVDQIALERPLLKAFQAKKKSAPGAKQYIVEQLRKSYNSNFQWYNGSAIVTYNKRQTLEQANYQWRSCHDGLALNEDQLAQNGIMITDDSGPSNASQAEKIQLTNLFEEQSEVLRLGFQEQFSYQLHLDGTQSPDAIAGLDALISLTPTSGVVGGIDRGQAGNAYWRNNFATGLTTTKDTGTILNQMEIGYRNCMRNGGRPDLMVGGSNFVDGYRNFLTTTFGRMDYGPAGFKRVEAGTQVMTFQGTDIQWSPEFQELDSRYAPATPWEKRLYMLNTQTITLRPLQGHDMKTRKPPRAYDRYEYYWGLTWKGALTLNRSNANGVFAIA
ncbi:phage major capsid protein [Herminiimonas contaminans]|uniref:Phage major capsid protein n=1 Tax=Herminiimonas contaminans TaxID=1111140 RepID=A0ABS0ETR6_9BURK|nr:phage major capsid protein [Herminiimonas contaminans]MBF8177242.1 phage major capsid protein [Herminiimonas contaminans]